MLDDKVWAESSVEMWADLNAGVGKEVYSYMAGNPGWAYEKHLDINAKTEHIMQTWQGSNESYFCRTSQPESLTTWLTPLSAASARASYKGEVNGSKYGALGGELLHHFQIKPLEAEHISLDFYTHLVGQDVIPAFVQLRIGSDVDDEGARFIAYKFDSFEPLRSLPAAGAIFDQSVSPDPFSVTHCADTLAYTNQDQVGTKIHPDNMIMSTDPLTAPLSRTALTYVLGAHPTWKASEIVAWEDQLSEPEYTKYQLYINPQHELALHNETRRALSDCSSQTKRCSSPRDIDLGGFPFDFANASKKSKSQMKKDSIFPCDVTLGFPKPCRGTINCAVEDIPLCCGGLVSGSVSGTGDWDCADDLSSCAGNLEITGGITVGIPKCKFCPNLLDFSVTYKRTSDTVSCCPPFAYTTDTITLAATFVKILQTELTGTFYQMATEDENACKTERPNYIDGANRKMVIKGRIEIVAIFSWTLVSGNIFMKPEAQEKPFSLPKSGDCCLRTKAHKSKKSCEYCPSGRRGGKTVKDRCKKDGVNTRSCCK